MLEYATRTVTSCASSSSRVFSTKPALIFLSCPSLIRNALNFSNVPPSLALQILRGLHLVQPANCTLKFGGVLARGEKLLRRRFRGGYQLDPVVVKHVHQPGETAGGVGAFRRHARDAGEHHGVKAPREVDVVRIGARPAAQHLEIEP